MAAVLGVGATLGVAAGPLGGCVPRPTETPGAGEKLVTDWRGRGVVVPDEPMRIAPLDAFAAEVLVMIGAGPRLVAAQDGTRASKLLCEMHPALASLPRFMADGAVNIESLLASAAEVVFIKETVYNSPGQTKNLDKTEIPYVVVDYYTLEEQLEAIAFVGEVCGGEPQARANDLVQYYTDIAELVEGRVADLKTAERPRVYHAVNVAVTTSGRRSVASDWIERAGAVNVSTEDGRAAKMREYKTSLEEVFAWDPDVVVCNEADTRDYFLSDSKWAGLRAVREGKVYQLPVGATRWGHWGSYEAPLAMLWMGATLFPERFADIDLKEKVVSYYRDIAGLAIDDTTYEMLMAGRGLRDKSAGDAG